MVGQLRTNSCLFNICLHLTKLSLLLPSSPSPSHTFATSLLTAVAIFLISFVVIREMLFEHSSSSSQVCGVICDLSHSLISLSLSLLLSLPLSLSISYQLLVHSGLLVIGLLVSWDAILVPLWASLTHQLPSTASLVGNTVIYSLLNH